MSPAPARNRPWPLSAGRLRVRGLLPGATNATLLADAGDGTTLLVYKPARGEAPLWDFPHGTLCRREVAAYEVAAALGWPDIPPTTMGDGPLGPGSLQLVVPHDPMQHYFTLLEGREAAFRRVAAFDVATNNADRKAGHCLLGEDGRIWLIDHGLCFHTEPKLRTVIWEFAGEEVPEEVRGDLAALAGMLRGGGPLAERLAPLLSAGEIAATAARAARLAEDGRFPHPGPWRHVPWPPV